MEVIIQDKLDKLMRFGESGDVRTAHEYFIKLQRDFLDLDQVKTLDPSHPSYRVQASMDVCDICGAILASQDNNAQRIESHLTGKQHNGYIRIREFLQEYERVIGSFLILFRLML